MSDDPILFASDPAVDRYSIITMFPVSSFLPRTPSPNFKTNCPKLFSSRKKIFEVSFRLVRSLERNQGIFTPVVSVTEFITNTRIEVLSALVSDTAKI